MTPATTHCARSARRGAPGRGLRRLLPALAALAVAACALPARAQAGRVDLNTLTLEQLMEVEVVVTGASKYAQQALMAPATLTVIDAQQIRRAGWRTLADVLVTVPGFDITYDRTYTYVGVRGFNRNAYNSRVVVLVDGQRQNDPVYDQAFLGTEFILDLELIERIEIVRGPGSAVYGSTALLGVVNVITRRGPRVDGVEASAEAGSFGQRRLRITGGGRSEGGLGWLASASRYTSDGPTLHFPELADAGNPAGVSRNDFDRVTRLFASADHGALRLTAAHSERLKGLATGIFGTSIGDPASSFRDEQGFARADFARELGAAWSLQGDLHAGRYRFEGDYHLSPQAGGVLNRERGSADWAGGELRLLHAGAGGGHRVVGLEFDRAYRVRLRNFDVDPPAVYADSQGRRSRIALYAQEERRFGDSLTVQFGARLDGERGSSTRLSPRLALIHQPDPASVAKLLFGTAFRSPSFFERSFDMPGAFSANPDLAPERIRNVEAAYSRRLTPHWRGQLTLYRYAIADAIDSVLDDSGTTTRFVNLGGGAVVGRGAEAEIEGSWPDRRLRASIAAQDARRAGGELTSSPRWLARFNATQAVLAPGTWLALEAQWTSRRRTELGAVGGYLTANAWFTQRLSGGHELGFGVRNLFDRRYADPVAIDSLLPARDALTQDGRTWRAAWTLRF